MKPSTMAVIAVAFVVIVLLYIGYSLALFTSPHCG